MEVQRRLSDGINGICQLLIIQGNKISGWEQISGKFKNSFFVLATFYFNYLTLSSRASVDGANFASLQMQNQITKNVENGN